jgi:hypothetical protein
MFHLKSDTEMASLLYDTSVGSVRSFLRKLKKLLHFTTICFTYEKRSVSELFSKASSRICKRESISSPKEDGDITEFLQIMIVLQCTFFNT